ncbi:MAG TPA: beta-ketoacyl-[acyl-carrier-protein] synthase family protein [Abditibacteriaceae bacterium]|nr:beta-ketoacyl-[acyl-carrier-protein] synthase family protein [Abditibacteriaceae bacterium]
MSGGRKGRPRAAVTGFYAGFGVGRGWREIAASTAPCLRAEFENYQENYRSENGTPRAMPDFECVIARALREMQYSGLWSTHGLTEDPRRVAVAFSASKNQPVECAKDWRTGGDWNRASDWPAIALARAIGATGPRFAPVAACATGAHALALGAQQIEDGYADVVLAGAVETVHTPLVMAGYGSLGVLSGANIMRPFDRRRDGFVTGAGAGCVILENEERALQRGATIHGYLSGWSMQADATAMTAFCPTGDSIARAIEVALRRADFATVDYINMHGTATKLNDVTETRGVKSIFGAAVPASSTKPLTGHLLGAAGAVEAVLCLAAMRENYAPPTLHLEEPDEACDLDYIALRGRTKNINTALSLNYGFGGHIGVLIFDKEN